MGKLTSEQRQRLFSDLSIGARANVTEPATAANPVPANDKAVIRAVDSARVHGQRETWDSHRETDEAFVIPSSIPQKIEDSGLVDLSMELDESQEKALRTIHEAKFVSLIGAAGTGKTTLVKRSIANHIYGGDGFEPRGIRDVGSGRLTIAICAFTGIATQVIKNTMPEWLHPCCTTIHSLLEYKPVEHVELSPEEREAAGRFVPTRNASNPLVQNRIYIDEVSMLGLDLWHKLLDACKPGTEIVLIGDLNQLPPVADVPFFPLALDAGLHKRDDWRLAELTTIHRQKGPGANRIIDTAHSILNGKRPAFDFELNAQGKIVDERGKVRSDAQSNPDWRVINIHVDANTDKAHRQIIQWLMRFKEMTPKSDPTAKVYNPYADLVLTAGNGWQPDQTGALVQQCQLNETLSDLLTPGTEENPTYYIDAGPVPRKYTVGDRVMCNANEPPSVKNRVTNGMLGTIIEIKNNGRWNGDRTRFGSKVEVDEHQRQLFTGGSESGALDSSLDAQFTAALESMENDSSGFKDIEDEAERRQASHIVTVRYVNGQERSYSSAAGVASTQLGFAVTTHKAQGSQAETVFIVCHGAAKFQLSREWLYTAVTRAQKRVVIFSTDLGLRTAVSRQKMKGATMQAKIQTYVDNVNVSGKYVQLTPAGHY